MQFRLINTGFNTPAMNMAIDEALLTSKMPVLRFYRWKPAGLSLGYFQDIKDINVDFCKKNNIDIVRRITGGKTVLHDKELTYSFIINESLMPKSIIGSYKVISKGILQALKELGIDASMKEEINKNLSIEKNTNITNYKKNNSAVCFNEPSYYEIIANNKKIVGSAQTRKQGKLLQHGAVLIDINVEKYVNCFNLENIKDEIKKSKNRITSINNELFNKKNPITKNKIKKMAYDDVAKAMEHGFKENFNVKMITGGLTEEELKLAKELEKNKYSKDSWNLKA